jgi:hypothetical protein
MFKNEGKSKVNARICLHIDRQHNFSNSSSYINVMAWSVISSSILLRYTTLIYNKNGNRSNQQKESDLSK